MRLTKPPPTICRSRDTIMKITDMHITVLDFVYKMQTVTAARKGKLARWLRSEAEILWHDTMLDIGFAPEQALCPVDNGDGEEDGDFDAYEIVESGWWNKKNVSQFVDCIRSIENKNSFEEIRTAFERFKIVCGIEYVDGVNQERLEELVQIAKDLLVEIKKASATIDKGESLDPKYEEDFESRFDDFKKRCEAANVPFGRVMVEAEKE
jgi:hypothetical protein